MSCFNQSTVPVISTLAKEFALIDEYYASVPGPTEVLHSFYQYLIFIHFKAVCSNLEGGFFFWNLIFF